MTFSCIRARGGWNNNPNCLQLKWALRQLFFKNSVKSSFKANCCREDYESFFIFNFRKDERSTSSSYHNDENLKKNLKKYENFLTTLFDLMESVKINFLQHNILYYITGCIIHKLLTKIECIYCHALLLTDTNNNIDHSYALDPNKEINK